MMVLIVINLMHVNKYRPMLALSVVCRANSVGLHVAICLKLQLTIM